MRRPKPPQESGYVIALTAISAMTLIILLGFSVDLGSWYLRATRLQRAADAAALAGAASLPDTQAATSEATSTFDHNGFNSSTTIVHTAAVDGGGVKTTVTDKAVPTYFLKMVFPSITLSRSSFAVSSSSIPLGSPFNVFGTGDLNLAGPDGVAKQGFWASVNAPCSAKEDGDYFLAQYDHNEPLSGSLCSGGGASVVNANYNPAGYVYAVHVPAGQTKAVDIDAYDPAFEWSWDGFPTNDNVGGVPADGDDAGDMDTIFIVWDTNNNPNDSSKWTAVAKLKYIDGDLTAANKWDTLYQIPAGSTERDYRIQVYSTIFPGDTINTGANMFSFIARPASDPDPTAGSTPVACDGRLHPDTCPVIYGIQAVSSYNNVSNGNTDFYLASLDPSYSGSTVTVYLWDPGEGTSSISFLPPYSSTPATFDWKASDGSSASNVTSLDVSGAGAADSTLHGTGRFNDQLLTLTVHIPTDYASHIAPGGDTWWKMRYTSGAAKVTDRITWAVNPGNSTATPPHLVSGIQ